MDILRLLDELRDMTVEDPRSILPGVVIGLRKDDINNQINRIRACLPQELKQAASTVRESERILEGARDEATVSLEQAQRDAQRITDEARAEAEKYLERSRVDQERMVSDSEILKLSKAQAEEIRNAAEREAREMRTGAERYAYDVLSQLEGVCGKVITTIERGKQEVRPAGPTNGTGAPREKVR